MSKESAIELWSKANKHLSGVLRPDVFSRWIAVIAPSDFHDNKLTLSVDNDFYQTWLEENYLSLIRTALASVHDSPIEIKFIINTEKQIPPETSVTKTIRERFTRRRFQPSLNPKFTFDEFVVGPSNSFAHAASLAVAQAPARAYNPLFIYGGSGLGKTHLMQAIGHHVFLTSRANVCYLSSEAFTNEYIDAIRSNSTIQFRKKYRNTDLLLIDDIHFLAGKEGMQEEFFHTFNALFDARKQIVMTSDRPAREITSLAQRLVSRFEWGLVTELEPPDLETRIAILRHKQKNAPMPLPEEFIYYIANNIRSNIRRLEGALVRTLSYTSLTGKELTKESLESLLRDTIDQEKLEELSFDKIQKVVAEYYDIRLADMTSQRRPRMVAAPRQVAMYLCRRMTRSSLPDIAKAFDRTHATILHAYKSVDGRMEIDQNLKNDIVRISEKLGRTISVSKVGDIVVNKSE